MEKKFGEKQATHLTLKAVIQFFDSERMASSALSSGGFTENAGEHYALWTRPKPKVSPRRVDEELWISASLSDLPKGRIPGNLKVLGLDPKSDYPTHSYDTSTYRIKSSSSGRPSSSKTGMGIFPSDSKSLHSELLFRPQHIESRQLSGSSTEAQLMQSNNLPPKKSTDENNTQLALSSLKKDHGLTYMLRRTDSNSTFQSLDGLNSAYPLIRKEAKKRKQKHHQRLRSGSKGTKGTRGSRRSEPRKTNALPDYALQCFGSPCLGVDNRVVSVRQERGGRPRSGVVTRDALLQLKSELSEMRQIASRSCNMSTAEKSRPALTKKVKFANPVVTLVNYRPYTDACDIPFLYFQEEELEELEWDREMDSGDQFECFILSGLAISVDHRVAAHE